MAIITALILTFCISQAQRWGVEAAGLPGPRGQTDGPTPATARPALGLGQRHIGIRRLVKDLEVQKGALITQHNTPRSVLAIQTGIQIGFLKFVTKIF